MSSPNLFRMFPSFSRILLPGAMLLAVGCSDDASQDPSPQPGNSQLGTIEIPATVERQDFCTYFDKVHCAAALNCCAAPAYDSSDACMQSTPCQKLIEPLLNSERVTNNELIYDASAAGTFLRARASDVSTCNSDKEPPRSLPFLVGTRDEGSDCTPTPTDFSIMQTCKPDLHCSVVTDEVANTNKGTCVRVDKGALAGAQGEACSTTEDCGTGSCVEGKCKVDSEALFCQPPPAAQTPPPNAAVAKMFIRVHSSDNSGTTGDVTLAYHTGGVKYECTITETLEDSGDYTCDVLATGSITSYVDGTFVVKQSTTDGLQMDKVCARDKNGNDINCAGSFYNPGHEYCNGCDFWGYCGRCWLDSDGHGKCKSMRINATLNSFSCN